MMPPSSNRNIATRAILLLEHAEHGHAEQALALVDAHDDEFRVLVLSELLQRGYRSAPAALLLSAGQPVPAHAGALRLASWAVSVNPPGRRGVRSARLLCEADPNDYAQWAPMLLRVLDATVFDQGGVRGSAVREVEQICIDLLEK